MYPIECKKYIVKRGFGDILMVSCKSCQFRYNTSEVKALLWAYLNKDLSKFNEGYMQKCKAITYEQGNGILLMSYIHQEEMHTLVEQFKSIKTWRASQQFEGWLWYSLMVWVGRIAPNSKGFEQMPAVEDKHIIKAVKELMTRYYKKVGDRFNG